ncbi:hypothetical protein TWF730_009842 [Orbilia blumenaviensis]|uniref:F-box domain-containing protein n=1 Tax=Orbilia blumenaviensis TaxID=1796055 RepID=A0AAV9UWE0_9PEZI
MGISTLTPELLLDIILFLDREDLIKLLQTCRYIYNIGYKPLCQKTDAKTLEAISELRGDVAGGVFNAIPYEPPLRKFTTSFTVTKTEDGSKTPVSGTLGFTAGVLIDACFDQICTGNRKITDGVFKLHYSSLKNKAIRRLLIALKLHSKYRPSSEFSITFLSVEMHLPQIPGFFDAKKLTRLSLRFHTLVWMRDLNKAHEESPEPQYIPPTGEVLWEIIRLRDLILNVPNLEQLSLKPQVVENTVTAERLTVLPRVLAQLKRAVLGLGKLHTVKITNYLFHPSFFLTLPATVKTLVYKNVNKLSPEWWHQFAKAPFPNVEELVIKLDSIPLSPIYRSIYDPYTIEGVRQELEKNNMASYTVEEVNIQNLKSFTCTGPENPWYPRLPRDLVECIKRKNKGLEDQNMGELVKSMESL